MTVYQMCTCGHKVAGATVTEAWRLLDEHCDEQHGRRFRTSGAVYDMAGHPASRRGNKKAPLTHHGGES